MIIDLWDSKGSTFYDKYCKINSKWKKKLTMYIVVIEMVT